MEDALKELAGAGPAVVAVMAMLLLVWRQFCALQDKVVQSVERQTQATEAQAASNRAVADAVHGLRTYLERGQEGEVAYRAGMKAFAESMSALANTMLSELREHRKLTEAEEKAARHKRAA